MIKPGAIVVILLAAILLAGCSAKPAETASPTEGPSPSVSAIPAPTRTPAVASIVISGSRVESRTASQSVMGIEPYSAGADRMVAFLSHIFGAPTVVAVAGTGVCADTYSRTYWGTMDAGLEVRVPAHPHPLDHAWLVSATAPSIQSVHIFSSDGFAVGDNTDSVVAALPATQKVGLDNPVPGGGSSTQVFTFDLVATISVNGESLAYGGETLSDSSIAREIFAPATRLRSGC